ncbi:MAG: ribosome silencing factor [Pseudonocardiales bacterium]|nr:ribosome silencing factor [Pseudonocardiales bacterium]
MSATAQAVELAKVAAVAASDKLAQDIVVLDVSERTDQTDCFVIVSGANERQVQAISDEIEERMRLAGSKPAHREGIREGRWVLLNFRDVVVHVQLSEVRGEFGLERLWKDCPRLEFPEARADPLADELR